MPDNDTPPPVKNIEVPLLDLRSWYLKLDAAALRVEQEKFLEDWQEHPEAGEEALFVSKILQSSSPDQQQVLTTQQAQQFLGTPNKRLRQAALKALGSSKNLRPNEIMDGPFRLPSEIAWAMVALTPQDQPEAAQYLPEPLLRAWVEQASSQAMAQLVANAESEYQEKVVRASKQYPDAAQTEVEERGTSRQR